MVTQKPQSIKVDAKLKNASALVGLIENSRKTLEDDFDQTAIRKDIVKRKSLFKSNIKLKEVLADQSSLATSIKGE